MPAGPQPDALVLCGGEGSRLGGIDKPLRSLGGQLLIERVLTRMASQTGRIRISANRNGDTYSAFGPVFGDGEFAGYGPLAGLAIGLGAASTNQLLCVPGDAPLLPVDLVARLDSARIEARADIAYAFDGQGPQPLCCLVDRALQGSLIDYLRAGGRTPREWFARHHVTTADFSDSPHWAWSLNTAEQWQHAEFQLAPPGLDS